MRAGKAKTEEGPLQSPILSDPMSSNCATGVLRGHFQNIASKWETQTSAHPAGTKNPPSYTLRWCQRKPTTKSATSHSHPRCLPHPVMSAQAPWAVVRPSFPSLGEQCLCRPNEDMGLPSWPVGTMSCSLRSLWKLSIVPRLLPWGSNKWHSSPFSC